MLGQFSRMSSASRFHSSDNEAHDTENLRPFIWAWIPAVTLGELVGFSIPALVGALCYGAKLSDMAMLPLFVVAGAAEGAILGSAQAVVLHRWICDLSRSDWVVNTAIAASIAWALGMMPALVGGRTDNVWVMVALSTLVTPLILISIGGAQWFVLRKHIRRAWRWIVVNACAWMAALPFCIGLISAVPNRSPAAAFIAAGLAGGAAMGFIVATITGIALVRMLSPVINGGDPVG